MAGTAEQVVAAVRVLYGPPSVAAQAQANAWLTAFQGRPEAWQVPFELLAPGQPGEVQFFGATVLVRKVRSEWGKLEPGSRQGLSQAIRNKFQEVLAWPGQGQPPASDLVLRQLCTLLAAVAGASGGSGATELGTQALGLLRSAAHTGPADRSQLALALHLLTALAHEAEDLDRVRRQALVNVLLPRAREVLGALGALLAAAAAQLAAGDPGPETATVAALQCLEAWLELNPVAGSGCILSPAELQQQQPQLFGALLALLTGRAPGAAGAAGAVGCSEEAQEAAGGVLLLVFGPENFAADEAADLAATSALVQALLALRGRLGQAASDVLPAAVARLASALAERSPEFCCGQMAEAAALSELVLECLGRPGPDMAAHTLDYFLMANTVPLAERPPALRGPLYEAALQRLVPHATYPAGFTSWQEEGEVDEDAFKRLREQHLPELLDVAYGLLRMRYLSFTWQLLRSAGSWQAAEAALLLFSAVSLAVKTRVLSDAANGGDENSGGSSGGGAMAAAVTEDRQQTQQLLCALFGQLCSPEGSVSMLSAHPALAEAACLLVEHYASWFGRAAAGDGGVPMQGAFELLLRALLIPQAAHTAAHAFQQLCLRCSWKVRDAASFGWLMGAAHGALQQAGAALPIADRQLVVEGLARVAAAQQGQQLLEAAARLTAPFVQAAAVAAAAAGGGGGAAPDGAVRRSLADSLRLLAAALRYLAPAGDDRGELGSQPAAQVLAQAAPTLQAVAESPAWQADREAVAAVAEVYLRAVGTAKQHGLQLALSALPAISALFAATAMPNCLDVVSEALEMQHEQPVVAGAAIHALAAACDTAMPALQGGGGLREHPALVSSLLALAHNCAVYAPAQLWSSAALPLLVQLAAAAAGLREADPVTRALELLSRLAATHEGLDEEGVTQAQLDAVHGVLAAQGEVLTARLLAALCDTCPRHLMRNAADVLRKLLGHPALGRAAAGWLAAAAASGQLPGAADGYLTSDDCASFASLAPQLAGPRFNALLVDFGKLARGENTSDVLLAYEM
ncbi:hypothetical protein ABPG75_008044 [Micractinium tetrahymenae]